MKGAPWRRAATHSAAAQTATGATEWAVSAEAQGQSRCHVRGLPGRATGAESHDPRGSCGVAPCAGVAAEIFAAHASKSFKRAGPAPSSSRRGVACRVLLQCVVPSTTPGLPCRHTHSNSTRLTTPSRKSNDGLVSPWLPPWWLSDSAAARCRASCSRPRPHRWPTAASPGNGPAWPTALPAQTPASRSRAHAAFTSAKPSGSRRPRHEVYAFWRRLENLPRFMEHLQSVTDLGGGGRTGWRPARAPRWSGTRRL